jgi:hypothetical protein
MAHVISPAGILSVTFGTEINWIELRGKLDERRGRRVRSVTSGKGMGALEEDLIRTEELFLISSQQHARLLRSQNRMNKDQKFQQTSVNKVNF